MTHPTPPAHVRSTGVARDRWTRRAHAPQHENQERRAVPTRGYGPTYPDGRGPRDRRRAKTADAARTTALGCAPILRRYASTRHVGDMGFRFSDFGFERSPGPCGRNPAP